MGLRISNSGTAGIFTGETNSELSVLYTSLSLSISCRRYLQLKVSNTPLPGEDLATMTGLNLQPFVNLSEMVVASPTPTIIQSVTSRLHLGAQLANHGVGSLQLLTDRGKLRLNVDGRARNHPEILTPKRCYLLLHRRLPLEQRLGRCGSRLNPLISSAKPTGRLGFTNLELLLSSL